MCTCLFLLTSTTKLLTYLNHVLALCPLSALLRTIVALAFVMDEVCVCFCWLYLCIEHIHRSPYLKPVVPALWCVQHSHMTLPCTPLYCTNVCATENLTSLFWFDFFTHQQLQSFCWTIFVSWIKHRYFLIFKEIYRSIYMYSIWNDDHYIYLLLFMWTFC